MELKGIKKYAQLVNPFQQSGARKAARAIKQGLAEANKSGGPVNVGDVVAKVKDEHSELFPSDKAAAHVAVKLLGSQSNSTGKGGLKLGQAAEAGAAVLEHLGGGERKQLALANVFSHYQNKSLANKIAIGTLAASVPTAIGAFWGAGPAGIIPLLAGAGAATAVAKSRKANARLSLLGQHGMDKAAFLQHKADVAKAAGATQGGDAPEAKDKDA